MPLVKEIRMEICRLSSKVSKLKEAAQFAAIEAISIELTQIGTTTGEIANIPLVVALHFI